MIRVLQVLQGLDMGGAETYVMNMYREMNREAVQFDFAVQHSGGVYEEEIKQLGGEIYYLPHFRFYNFKKFENKVAELLDNHPEITIVHSHNNNIGAFIMRVAKKSGEFTTVSHAHTNKKHISNWKDAVYNCVNPYTRVLFNKYADYCLACSDKAGMWQYGTGDYSVVNNSIDLRKFICDEYTHLEAKKKYNLEGKKVIGNIGRLEKVKNQRFLINVFAKICSLRNDVVLIIVGEGKEKKKLIQYSKKLGVGDNIIFLDNQQDIEKIYQLMDVFVLPSLYEGFPMTLIEAQASGLPCIVSDQIENDVDLTDLVVHLPLNSKNNAWETTIMNNFATLRNAHFAELQGFDIHKNANKMQHFYEGIVS